MSLYKLHLLITDLTFYLASLQFIIVHILEYCHTFTHILEYCHTLQ